MATPTGTLAMEMMERLRRDIEKSFFSDILTTTASERPEPKPITSDTIRGWIEDVGRFAYERIEPMMFTILDAQQQRRTPVIGAYYVRAEKRSTPLRKRRKCSRRKWQSMNRRQWTRIPIYAEPEDVLVINGKSIVTPRQYHALKQVTIKAPPHG